MWLLILIAGFIVLVIILYLTRYPKCIKGGRCNSGKSKTSKRYYEKSFGMIGGNTSFYCSKCGNNVTDYLKI